MKVLRPAFAFATAAGLLVALQGLLLRNAAQQREAVAWVTHTHEVIEALQMVASGVGEAEAALRGFIATGQLEVIAPFPMAMRETERSYSRALALTKDNPEQQRRLLSLGRVLRARMDQLRWIAKARPTSANVETSPEARGATATIREQVVVIIAHERELLSKRAARTELSMERTSLMAWLGAIAAVVLVAHATWLLRIEDARRRHAESTLRQRVEIGQLLQACRERDEAHALIHTHLQRTFPGCSGAVYEIQPSRDSADARVRWGTSDPVETFAPHECWALRRGQPHEVDVSAGSLACAHARLGQADAALCYPLTAQGELIGLLHLACKDRALQEMRAGVQLVADGLAIAIANQRLNETLRMQSVRDPLTGLYNRRYLEETLDRELAQVARSRGRLGVIILDADHFKQFNDTFGHQGGDLVLRELGGVLRAAVRGGDVAARYGGEEFALLFSGTGPESALARAESIRAAVAALEVVHGGSMLGAITISAGVACFPQQGRTREDLIRSADAALYAAKRGGRNRVALGAPALVRHSSMPETNEVG